MKFVIPIVWALAMVVSRFADPLPVIFVAAVTMAAIVLWRERQVFRPLMRITPRVAMLAVVAAIAMIAVTYLGFPIVSRWIPAIATEAAAIYGRFLSSRSPGLVIAAVVAIVVAEEVLWRGTVQEAMRRWSVIGTAAIYAIAHAPSGSLLLVVVAFVCGLYWSALREVSGSLVPPLCAHLVWDIALIVFPLVRS